MKKSKKTVDKTRKALIDAALTRREAIISKQRIEFEKVRREYENAKNVLEDVESNIEDIGYEDADELETIEDLLNEFNVRFSDAPDWDEELHSDD